MKNMQLNSIESALELIHKQFDGQFNQVEYATLETCFHRTLAEDIISQETIPAFPKSTVDGYALHFTDEPCVLSLTEKIDIGTETVKSLRKGTCVYVPTGAMLPLDADTMVMIEDTTLVGDNEVHIHTPVQERQHIIEIGDDMFIGKKVLSKNTLITAHEIGALASLGISKIPVRQKPRVTFFSTGDELVAVDQEAKVGQIREINTYTLSALAQEMGMEVVECKIVKDDYAVLETEFRRGIEQSDLVVVSGGSSVGEKDYTFDLLNGICDAGVLMNGMAIKPGKPTIIARDGHKPVIGLPGHPVSSIIVFKVIVGELMKSWGFEVRVDRPQKVVLTEEVYAAKGRDTYQMVSIVKAGGSFKAHPTSGKSGMITLLTGSNGYVIIPKEAGVIRSGEEVEGFYFY